MLKQRICQIIFISCLAILTKPEAYAQEKLSAGISAQMINTRFLVNVSNFKTKGAFRPTTILFTEYCFSKKYSVHTGFGYSMMTQNSDAFKNNFHYLVMPMYLKTGRLKEDKRIAFETFYGFNFHFLLSAQHIFSDKTHESIMNQCRKFHFDIAAGAGLKIKISERMVFEALSAFSLGYFINKRNAVHMDINNFNSGLMLNLSYKLK
jgi:hypothetical protein